MCSTMSRANPLCWDFKENNFKVGCSYACVWEGARVSEEPMRPSAMWIPQERVVALASALKKGVIQWTRWPLVSLIRGEK